jgi:Flp pilus assembly protein TadG
MSWRRSESGQATVEFVALLPLLAVVGFCLWQAILAGQAAWLAGSAARAAARTSAVGGDVRSAAAAVLPASLRRGLRVERREAGTVQVRVRVPAVVGSGRVATVSSTAHFEVQR